MFQRRRSRGPEVQPCPRVPAVPNAGESWVPKVSNDTALAFGQLFCHCADSVSPEVTKRTEKEWARYRAETRLDIYGRRITSTAESVGKDSMCGDETPEQYGAL